MIADVIVDIAASETDRIYSYLCDDTVAEGSRVYAPFGGRVLSWRSEIAAITPRKS